MPDYVARDHELEAVHERSGEALAEHRWHWTADESNPKRVSFAEYARNVHRTSKTIRAQVHGYVAWREGGPGALGLTECIERAKLGVEKTEAAEAVAKVRDIDFATAAKHHHSEVTQVLDQARDRVERRGTSLSEELPRVAAQREASRTAHSNMKADLARAKGIQLVLLEGHLGKAIRDLREALEIAREIDFDDEQVEMIAGTLASLRTVVGLIDVRLTGKAGVDWDRSFADFMEEPT